MPSNPVNTITTHKEDAFTRLLQQYKDKPNLKKIIEIYADRQQDLELVFVSLYLARSVNDAVGAQLDQVGEIVGLARPGSLIGNDDAYRTLIFVKIGQNVSQGEAERIINVAKLLTGSEYVHLLDILNGNVELTITTDLGDQETIDSTYRNMEIVLAAGVRVAAILCADPEEAFAFDGPNVDAPALGFDDGTGTVGGKFAKHHEFKPPFAFDGVDQSARGFGAGPDDPLCGGVFVEV